MNKCELCGKEYKTFNDGYVIFIIRDGIQSHSHLYYCKECAETVFSVLDEMLYKLNEIEGRIIDGNGGNEK